MKASDKLHWHSIRKRVGISASQVTFSIIKTCHLDLDRAFQFSWKLLWLKNFLFQNT